MTFRMSDPKPHNIFLTKKGSIKLGDFGVGVQLQEDFRKSKKGNNKYKFLII